MNLLIVESPAKCKKIASFLGPSYRVLATMGHIRALDEDLDAVGIDRDFEPRFKFIKEKTKSMKAILEAAVLATTIYLAADDDREGEAIAYSVACLLKKDPLSFPRAVFHEITETAIRAAVANPRKIDLNKVYAQQARSVLDMLVGFTISPLLWKHVGRGLSAGRCQTPALRLVYDRERSIKSHTTETSWIVKGKFPGFEAKMDDELEDQESALNYLENIHLTQSAIVATSTTLPWTANPPKPLITSTLQQEASALYKMNPKSTMKIAQALYEAGHITYMRTDFAVLSEEAIAEAKEWVKEAHGAAYVGSTLEKGKEKAKHVVGNAQEAHEAIRPTHFDLEELPGDWTPHDKKIYALIWKRAVQSVMAPAKGQNLTVKLIFAGDTEFPWTARWKKTDFQGWQILGMPADLDSEEEEEDSEWKYGIALTKGTVVEWSNIQAAPKRSKASPRFTEATLIRELEKKGIGRPSTFASLVEVLFEKSYVEKKDITGEKAIFTTLNIEPSVWPPITQSTQISLGSEKQKLVPTALGSSVVEFCLKEFPQLFAYDFTAQMENRLDAISHGKEPWKALCHTTWDSYKDDYKRLSDKASLPSSSEKVKDFGNGFKAVVSKSGPLLVQEGKEDQKATFYPFPPKKTVLDITEEEARAWIIQLEEASNMGQFNGEPIIKKKGPYGNFLECKGIRIAYEESDTAEQILVKFTDSAKASENKVTVGPYRFAIGKYGPYMYKDIVKKIFVSIPSNINPKNLTEAEAAAIYKNGIEAKKNSTTQFGDKGRGGKGGRGGRGGRGSS
jgi:DNA topoisomerase-1